MRIYVSVDSTKAHVWMAELYCATRLVAWRVAGCRSRSLRGVRLLSRVRGHVPEVDPAQRPTWEQAATHQNHKSYTVCPLVACSRNA